MTLVEQGLLKFPCCKWELWFSIFSFLCSILWTIVLYFLIFLLTTAFSVLRFTPLVSSNLH